MSPRNLSKLNKNHQPPRNKCYHVELNELRNKPNCVQKIITCSPGVTVFLSVIVDRPWPSPKDERDRSVFGKLESSESFVYRGHVLNWPFRGFIKNEFRSLGCFMVLFNATATDKCFIYPSMWHLNCNPYGSSLMPK